ncbi:MAG: type II toxin-antitoxin system VapC family toxin [Terracidiphilus sp.]
MSVLLDTDVVIEIQRGTDRHIGAQWASLVTSGALILYSPIVAAETWAGARPQEHSQVESFFDALICLPADDRTGRLAGDLLHKYARSHNLEVPDAFIAAAAIQHKASLWTRNRKHYPMTGLSFYS